MATAVLFTAALLLVADEAHRERTGKQGSRFAVPRSASRSGHPRSGGGPAEER